MATNVDAKLLKQTKFPPEFSQKVDMNKVNVEVMKKSATQPLPDIKVLQIQLTGFLDKDTPKFCKELWTLCLSAQSNPQGVPKELLEAKKLELIQEKSKNERGIGISTTSGNESGLNEVVVVEEVTEDIATTTGVHLATQGLLHRGANPHLTEATIVAPRQEIMSTHIFLLIKLGGDMTVVLVHLLFDDLPADVAGTVPADHQRLFVTVVVKNEGRGFLAVVVIVLEPIHPQTRLAHDHPEDPEGDTVLQYHPAVLLLRQGRNTAGMGTLRGPRHLCRGLVLIRLNEFAGRLVGRDDLRLILVMKWMIHALMLAKDEATTTVDIKRTAVTAVDPHSTRIQLRPEAEVPAYRDSERGKGIGL
ncbi:MAG: hypothetical protein Q9223_001590 [Gallowayella weberi]